MDAAVIQVWAPQHGVPFALEGHSNPYLSLLWPFALQHDMCFEAIIALCRAAWLTDQGRSSRHDGAYVFHRRNVMDTLRKRLLVSHQCADDATILTIAALGTIDYVLGDHTSAVSNVQVMREVVKVRGGLKSSSPWEQLIKHNVLAYEALWSFLVDPATLATVNTHSGPMVEKAELPIYMTHPFKPEVCEMLSKLPQGFCDVGLNGIFSLQMIRLLHDLGAQRAHLSAGKARGETETNSLCKLRTMLTDFHRLATLHTTPTEHFLCYGLIAYCYLLRFIYFQERPNALDEKAIGALFGSATATNTGEELGTEAVDRRCFLWTVMLIGAVLQHTEKIPSGWHSVMDQLLDRYHEARDWDMLEQELRLCFWDDPVRDMCRFSHQEAGRRKQRQSECDREQRRSTMAIRNVIL